MDVEINWLAVLLAPVVSSLVGFVWYSPFMFDKLWRKLAGLEGKAIEEKMKKRMAKAMLTSAAMSWLTAFILAHFTFYASDFYFEKSWMSVSLTTAFMAWFGFQLTQFVTHDGFEMRPTKLTLINAGNQFFTLMGYGLLIGLLK